MTIKGNWGYFDPQARSGLTVYRKFSIEDDGMGKLGYAFHGLYPFIIIFKPGYSISRLKAIFKGAV